MRVKPTIPDIRYMDNGFPRVFTSPTAKDWGALSWGRYGSGGKYDCRHCFVDDWRLEFLWRHQGEGAARLLETETVTGPDFTIDLGFPSPASLYHVWRSAALSALWQSHGVTVVPVLQWGGPFTYMYSSLWILPGSVVAVRGPQKGFEGKWSEMFHRVVDSVRPGKIIQFGRYTSPYNGVVTVYIPLHSRKRKNEL